MNIISVFGESFDPSFEGDDEEVEAKVAEYFRVKTLKKFDCDEEWLTDRIQRVL